VSLARTIAEVAAQAAALFRAESALMQAAARFSGAAAECSRLLERETREIARASAESDALQTEITAAARRLREEIEGLMDRAASLPHDPGASARLEQLTGAIRGSFATIEAARRRIDELAVRAERIAAALSSRSGS
jgi:chromosome segregation ATPase